MTPSRTLATSSQRSVASSRKSSVSFHFITTIGSRSSSNSRLTACWWMRSASFSRRLISTACVDHAFVLLQRVEREPHLFGAGGDDLRRARGRRSGRVSSRYSRTSVADASIASITSSSERASAWMSSRSSGVTNVRLSRWMISCVRKSHLCSTSLISSALSQTGSLGRQHLFEQPRAVLQLVGQRLEVAVELFFPRNQIETPIDSPSRSACAAPQPKPGNCSRSVYTVVTSGRTAAGVPLAFGA